MGDEVGSEVRESEKECEGRTGRGKKCSPMGDKSQQIDCKDGTSYLWELTKLLYLGIITSAKAKSAIAKCCTRKLEWCST